MLIDVVRGIGQAKDVLATYVFGEGVGVVLIRCVAMWVLNVWCGMVSAGRGRWYHVGWGVGGGKLGVGDVVELVGGVGQWQWGRRNLSATGGTIVVGIHASRGIPCGPEP